MDGEKVAVALGQGGAAVAACLGSCGLLNFFDEHYRAIMAFSAFGSFILSAVGYSVSWYYKHKRKPISGADET